MQAKPIFCTPRATKPTNLQESALAFSEQGRVCPHLCQDGPELAGIAEDAVLELHGTFQEANLKIMGCKYFSKQVLGVQFFLVKISINLALRVDDDVINTLPKTKVY